MSQVKNLVTQRAFPSYSEPKIFINVYYKDIGLRSSLPMYVLGLKPESRTKDRPRRGKRYEGSPCQQMMRSVLVIMAHKCRPRTNVTSNKQSRGPNRWYAVQGDIPGNSEGIDMHCKNKVQREVLKYLKRKLLPPH